MQAQCAFCRFCLDDSQGIKKRLVDGGLSRYPWECECVDTAECSQREVELASRNSVICAVQQSAVSGNSGGDA
jgi:hypothetical protein